MLLLSPQPGWGQEEAPLTEQQRAQELVKTQIKMAELYEAKDDLKSALKIWRQLVAEHPDDLDFTVQLARLAHELNRHEVLLDTSRRLVNSRPSHLLYRFWLSKALLAHRQVDQALVHLNWLRQKQPNDAEIRKELASAYETLKRPDLALEQMCWLIRRFPESVEYRITRAHLFADLKQPAKQIADLQAAAKMAPRNVQVHLELGDLHLFEDRHDRAGGHYRIALDIEPGNMTVRGRLARLKRARQSAERKALRAFRRQQRYQDWLNDLQERAEDF
jgi:predicted Zn-dependent protease